MTGVERTLTRIRGFASSEMDFQLMRMLGAATAGGGSPGEIFAARAQMASDDPYLWPAAFGAMADRLVERAERSVAAGHVVSAAGHWLRACSYYRSAEYYSDPFGTDGAGYGHAGRRAFIQASRYLPHVIQPVDIPFEGNLLPGYFMQPAGGAVAGRTVIIITGFDGTGEELYFQSAAEGLARGFNVLVAEGPGQVGCLRRYPDCVFRPDYEKPLGAVVDYALARPEVSPRHLALYGISFGGYFALRGAANDARIRALVANSPIVDLGAYMKGFTHTDGDTPDGEQDVALSEVDDIPDEYMPHEIKLSFKAACRRFGVDSFSGWFRALVDYRVDNVSAIQCPVLALVGAGEGAESTRQMQVCETSVSGPVTSYVFTAEEGADMHCQLGNLPLSNAVVYDWLQETLAP